MALNIANPQVEQKAIRVSELLGSSKTAAVETALDFYLAQHQPHPELKAARHAASHALDDLARLPVLDDRSPEVILGYDEHGLP